MFKLRLSLENSIIVSLGVAALIMGIYNYKAGPVADAHATAANDGNLSAAVKKAGWQALILTAGVTVLAGDLNVAIMGGAAIISEELSYRHAIMASPDTGRIEVSAQDYMPAGEPVGSTALGTYAPPSFEAEAG